MTITHDTTDRLLTEVERQTKYLAKLPESGVSAVTHAVRSGDRGGSGTSVSVSEDR